MLFLQGVLVSSYLLEIWKERSISGSRGARLDVGPVRHDGVETPKRVGCFLDDLLPWVFSAPRVSAHSSTTLTVYLFMFSLVSKRAVVSVAAAGALTHAHGRWQNRQLVFAHCQVPCGIYDDSGRIKAMKEDVKTITKAMAQVKANPARDAQTLNQSVRWINTKEDHASKIISTVSEYFLTQKMADVKKGDPKYGDYLEALALHHQVMRLAMKAKQNTDEKIAQDLLHAVEHLEAYYGLK